MNFKPLTHEERESMPLSAWVERRRTLAHIVEQLGRDHYARYQGPRDARLAEWAEARKAAMTEPVFWGAA